MKRLGWVPLLIVLALVQTAPRALTAGEASSLSTAAKSTPELQEAEALDDEVRRLYQAGKYAEAVPVARRALESREQALGPEHPATALSLNNLGVLLQAMGDLAGALPYYEHALSIDEKTLGPQHPQTARSLNNLGGLLQATGDLAGALPYYERALAIHEKVLGSEHPDTATSYNNLGSLLQATGDLAGALPYYERALTIHEKVLGPEHPETATSLNNLGSLLQATGDLAGALPYYERAVAIHEKVLGPEHPDTATSLNNLGGLLQATGDLAGARRYYERALAIDEKALGPLHPQTAVSLSNLGALQQAMGDLVGARSYYERALAIDEEVLGPEHPATARNLDDLGGLLVAMNDPESARTYYERALAIREEVLGPEHPETAQSLENLGALEVDRPKRVRRYPTIQSPDSVKPFQQFSVLVSLTLEKSVEGVTTVAGPGAVVSEAGKLEIPLSAADEPWRLKVVLSAPGFEIVDRDWQEIVLPYQGDSTPALFHLKAAAIEEAEQTKRLTATLWHKGAYLASFSRSVTVANVTTTPQTRTAEAPVTARPRRVSSPSTELDGNLKPPDLTVFMQGDRDSDELIIIVNSPYLAPTAEVVSVPPDMDVWLDRYYARFARLGRGVVPAAEQDSIVARADRAARSVALLEGFGLELYDKFAPPAFKEAFRNLARALGLRLRLHPDHH
jgi:tetratricopeptide (TPR) repeat protein